MELENEGGWVGRLRGDHQHVLEGDGAVDGQAVVLQDLQDGRVRKDEEAGGRLLCVGCLLLLAMFINCFIHSMFINSLHSTFINSLHNTLINSLHSTLINSLHSTLINGFCTHRRRRRDPRSGVAMGDKGGQWTREAIHSVGETRERRHGHNFGKWRVVALLGRVDENAAALHFLLERSNESKPFFQTVEPDISSNRNGD